MSKIIFLDIDGPMIPGRAYTIAGHTKPLVMKFDPVAVGLLNNFCRTRNWQIVIHSSWVRIMGGMKTYEHCLAEGLDKELFHKDAYCDENENWRYTRVAKWLHEHPETTHYLILDDEPYKVDLVTKYPHPEDMEKHLVLIDFEEGMLTSTINQMGGRDSKALQPVVH
jgi:hypothetical protein